MQHEDNPLGFRGLEFVEFATPDPQALSQLFIRLGFRALARHRTKDVTLYRQGDINFLINARPNSFASRFADVEGLGVVAIGMRVDHAGKSFNRAIKWGAWPFENEHIGPHELRIPAIQGIGHSLLYFVEQWRGKDGQNASIFDVDFIPEPGVEDVQAHVAGLGLDSVDHLSQIVSSGTLDEWKDFYSTVLHFSALPDAHAGDQAHRDSNVLVSPDHLIRVSVHEEGARDTGIMHRYLHDHATEGVQHVALATSDIFATVERIRANGLEFVVPPPEYYERLEARLPDHGLDLEALKRCHILVDGETGGADGPKLLLQTFLRSDLGEMALEIIERRGDLGCGEGNLLALEP